MKSIILRDWEVRGILEGRISQLRRPIKPQPEMTPFGDITCIDGKWYQYRQTAVDDYGLDNIKSPFGQVGDLIQCKETWLSAGYDNYGRDKMKQYVFYKADGWTKERMKKWGEDHSKFPPDLSWKPSATMPREYSRIILQTDEIWAERLQEISDSDITAMGIFVEPINITPWHEPTGKRIHYARLWDSIYQKQGLGWDANPYVFAAKVHRAEG